MTAAGVFGKLQLRDETEIVVLNAPPSFESALKQLRGVTIHRTVSRSPIRFALAFVARQAELARAARTLAELAPGDAALWFAYPKASSKRYTTDIARDAGWQVLGELGFEAVRMVAIDDDWSAKRYRRPAFIKTMTRDAAWAMTNEGKAKTRKRGAARPHGTGS